MTVRKLIAQCDLVPSEDTTGNLLEICTRQQIQIAALKKTLGTFIAWSVRELGQESVKELLGQLEEVES
jgi:hypothetical protein